jgi:hypothetical protein
VPPDALNLDDVAESPPRPRLAMHEMRRQLADLSLRLHHDGRRRPRFAVFRAPDRRPSRLRCLSGEWRDHRRHCEPEGSEHCQNEVDQNCLKADSDDLILSDPTNQTATVHPIEMMVPNEGLSWFGPTMNRSKNATNSNLSLRFLPERALRQRTDGQNCQSLIGLKGAPNCGQPNQRPNRPWIHPSNRPLPGPTSRQDARRLEGRLTCPSATNWKKKDWAWAQPTGRRPQS